MVTERGNKHKDAISGPQRMMRSAAAAARRRGERDAREAVAYVVAALQRQLGTVGTHELRPFPYLDFAAALLPPEMPPIGVGGCGLLRDAPLYPLAHPTPSAGTISCGPSSSESSKGAAGPVLARSLAPAASSGGNSVGVSVVTAPPRRTPEQVAASKAAARRAARAAPPTGLVIATLQLPALMYTFSHGFQYKWTAALEYADDEHGRLYTYVNGQRKRAGYFVRIVSVELVPAKAREASLSSASSCSSSSSREVGSGRGGGSREAGRESGGAPSQVLAAKLAAKGRGSAEGVPEALRALVGLMATSPTKANGLIKGNGAKHSESGWEAWKFEHNHQPIKTQKTQISKQTREVKFVGGGFRNPTERAPEHARELAARLGVPVAQLPPPGPGEIRDYFYDKCDVTGTIKRFNDAGHRRRGAAHPALTAPSPSACSPCLPSSSAPPPSPSLAVRALPAPSKKRKEPPAAGEPFAVGEPKAPRSKKRRVAPAESYDREDDDDARRAGSWAAADEALAWLAEAGADEMAAELEVAAAK